MAEAFPVERFAPPAQVGDAYMALNNRFMPLSWVVRTKVAPFSVSAPIQRAFQDAADLPAAHIRSMDQIVIGSTARPVQHAGAGHFRGGGHPACVDRPLWTDGLLSGAADARIRHPAGAGRRFPGAAEHDRAAGHDAGRRGDLGGAGRRVRADAVDGELALWREADRSGGLRYGYGRVRRRGVSGGLSAGAAGVAGGPGGRAAG